MNAFTAHRTLHDPEFFAQPNAYMGEDDKRCVDSQNYQYTGNQ